ncbi:uncharacterized protein [Drosophila kikkawai]|uniref:Uncharacterized protein n=1 Tax=Drosophila kikkawai TaxID=30033 RepID=A0A6P4IWZ0_DROKI|nr:uncharacterized protein LOC108082246 [Drosophila kikkawai]
MDFKTACLICLAAFLFLSLQSCSGREYQFIPARCVEQPGVDRQIGGPLSLCTFPPSYQSPSNEDIQAVIKHIKSLKLD